MYLNVFITFNSMHEPCIKQIRILTPIIGSDDPCSSYNKDESKSLF